MVSLNFSSLPSRVLSRNNLFLLSVTEGGIKELSSDRLQINFTTEYDALLPKGEPEGRPGDLVAFLGSYVLPQPLRPERLPSRWQLVLEVLPGDAN